MRGGSGNLCGSVVWLARGHGDRVVSFRCELGEGHRGGHTAAGVQEVGVWSFTPPVAFRLTWSENTRDVPPSPCSHHRGRRRGP